MDIKEVPNRVILNIRISPIEDWLGKSPDRTQAKLARNARISPGTLSTAMKNHQASAKVVRSIQRVIGVEIIDRRKHPEKVGGKA